MRVVRISKKYQITIPKEERSKDLRGKRMIIEKKESFWTLTLLKDSIIDRVAGKVDIEPGLRDITNLEFETRSIRHLE